MAKMFDKLVKYAAILKINFIMMFSYKPLLIGRLPIFILLIFLINQLYLATYSTTNVINDLTYSQTVWLVMLVQAMYSASAKKLPLIISKEINSGALAYFVNKPYSYILFHYSSYIGQILPSFILILFLGISLTAYLVGSIPFDWFHFALGSVLIFFGFSLAFLILFTIGLLAFWIGNVEPVEWIFSKFMLVFGGSLIPLAFYSGILKVLAQTLPFSLLFYVPAKTIISFDCYYFYQMLALQIFWLILLALLANFIFQKGMKNVSLNGG